MIQYSFEPDRQRSTAVSNGQVIGLCQYQVQNGAWYIVHTEVDPAWGGQGIARRLVEIVAREAEKAGAPVVPVCSYAAKVLG